MSGNQDDIVAEIEKERDALREWKAEATKVLADWDAVWEFAGKPGPLGGSKSKGVAEEIKRLRQLLTVSVLCGGCGKTYTYNRADDPYCERDYGHNKCGG